MLPCRYYYDYNTGLQAQSSLYSMATVDDIENAILVFDPNTLSKDGTVAVDGYSFNWNGDLIAYNVARCDTCPFLCGLSPHCWPLLALLSCVHVLLR